MPALATIKPRRATAAEWITEDPILATGELGIETDTGKFKLGDGTTAWSGLLYGVRPTLRSASGNTTIADVDADFIVYTGTGGHTITLRPASVGGLIYIKNCGSGSVTVSRAGGDTIFASSAGGTSISLSVGDAVTLKDTSSSEWGVF